MRVEGVKFAIVPEWVIDRLADKPRALVVYARLSRWSNVDGDVNRSRADLAAACSISRDTLDRAMTDLKQSGCLIVTPRHDKQGNQLCNRYTLTSQPVPHIDGTANLPPTTTSRGTANLRGGANLRPQEDKPKKSSLPKKEAHADRTENQQKHDRMVDALIGAMGWVREQITETEWGRTHAAAKELTDIGADPEQIAARAERYPEMFRGCSMTPKALSANWAALAGDWRTLIEEET